MSKDTHRPVILGAGLSGLSAGYHSGFPLYEASQSPGGTANSICKDGFVFDIGIHVLQSKDEYFLGLMRKLGVALVTHKRNGWIYSRGRYSLYPFQVNTSHLPLAQRLRCVIGFLLRSQSQAANYEGWLMQNLGRGFARNFLIPYARKFWGVSPKEITCEWVRDRVPLPGIGEVIKGMFRDHETLLGTHTKFQYPAQPGAGFAIISQALAGKLKNIHYRMKATRIDPYKKLIIFDGNEAQVPYGYLLTTIPLPEILMLLPDLPTEIRDAADKLAFNSIGVVNLGVAHPKVSDKHWVHFPEEDISFFRVSFPSNFSEGLCPAGTSSVQAEVSYDRENPPSPEDLKNRVHKDLIKVGILENKSQLVFKDVVYQKYGYVIYDHNRTQAVSKIHDYLYALEIYPFGRYGSWEYLWSDEAVLSGRNVVEWLAQAKYGGDETIYLARDGIRQSEGKRRARGATHT
jgi:UDP-galactopyranose mutase